MICTPLSDVSHQMIRNTDYLPGDIRDRPWTEKCLEEIKTNELKEAES